MVPKSGDLYSTYTPRDHSMFRDRDSLLYNADNARAAAYHPDGYYDNNSYQKGVHNIGDRNSTMNRSGRSVPDVHDDDGFRDSVRLRQGSGAKNRSRSQPVYRHSDEPRYPVPERPRSRGHSLPRDHSRHPSFNDDTIQYGPQSQVPPRSPQHPASQTPTLSSVIPGNQTRSLGYHGDNRFPAQSAPLSSAVDRPGFPRHSSMKPGQTYLTEDLDNSAHPFMTNDISSVLPSPFPESLSHKPYHPYQNQYPNVSNQSVPYVNQSRFPNQSRDGSFGDMDNTVVARQHDSPDRTMSRTRTASGEESSESSGRPFNYTRDQLLGAVDQVRRSGRGSKRGRGYGQQWGSGTDFSESPTLSGHGAQIPESAKPSVIVRDRPSRGFSYDPDHNRRPSNGHSVNSSGTGSYLGRNRAQLGSDHSRRDDLTPDSISSGIGSRNTSSQLTGSSLHSRPSRLGSSGVPVDPDMSHDSVFPVTNYPHQQRKDISGDENYEFDSYNAVESDLLEALRNYSEVNNGNEELLSALQEGLSTSGLMSELYPKPSRQSRYSDSEQRFEKLRGEFQKYRQQQQEGSRQEYGPRSSRDNLHTEPHTDSYRSSQSSRQSAGNYGHPDSGNYFVRGSDSNYKAGPMDSDML